MVLLAALEESLKTKTFCAQITSAKPRNFNQQAVMTERQFDKLTRNASACSRPVSHTFWHLLDDVGHGMPTHCAQDAVTTIEKLSGELSQA